MIAALTGVLERPAVLPDLAFLTALKALRASALVMDPVFFAPTIALFVIWPSPRVRAIPTRTMPTRSS